MRIVREALAGTLESNDALVRVAPSDTLAIDVKSTVLAQYGAQIHEVVQQTLERLKGEPSYNLFRDYHAGLILDAAGRRADAEKRLKSAYDAEKTTLRLVDLWARFQARNGDFRQGRLLRRQRAGAAMQHGRPQPA